MSSTDVITTPKKTNGRPSEYDPVRGARVADYYAQGLSKDSIAKFDWAPSANTMRRWERNHEQFRVDLACARKPKGEYHAEAAGKALEVDLSAVEPKVAGATVNLAGKKSDYHKWMAGCMDRDTYSDRGLPEQATGNQTIVIFNGLQSPTNSPVEVSIREGVVTGEVLKALPAPPCGHQGNEGPTIEVEAEPSD